MNRRSFTRQLGGSIGTALLPSMVSGLSLLPSTFLIAQLVDLHIGAGGAETNSGRLRTAIEKVNAPEVEPTVVCGDLVDIRRMNPADELKSISSTLKRPYFVVPGNHDTGMIPSAGTLREYRKDIGKDNYETTQGPLHLVVVNTQLWVGGPCREREAHDKWLASVPGKKKKDAETFVVCGHLPLFVAEPTDHTEVRNQPRKQIHNIFFERIERAGGFFFGASCHPALSADNDRNRNRSLQIHQKNEEKEKRFRF